MKKYFISLALLISLRASAGDSIPSKKLPLIRSTSSLSMQDGLSNSEADYSDTSGSEIFSYYEIGSLEKPEYRLCVFHLNKWNLYRFELKGIIDSSRFCALDSAGNRGLLIYTSDEDGYNGSYEDFTSFTARIYLMDLINNLVLLDTIMEYEFEYVFYSPTYDDSFKADEIYKTSGLFCSSILEINPGMLEFTLFECYMYEEYTDLSLECECPRRGKFRYTATGYVRVED